MKLEIPHGKEMKRKKSSSIRVLVYQLFKLQKYEDVTDFLCYIVDVWGGRMMKKMYPVIMTMCIIFIIGCSDISKYNGDDVVAVVRGEEMTIGQLRFLYPDDKVLEMVEGEVKATLLYQEAKKTDVHVDVDELTGIMEGYPSNSDDSQWAKSTRKFAEKQAKKLGMEPEDYYKQYVAITAEKSSYINAYIIEKLAISSEDEIDEESIDERANEFINDLVLKYEDEIEIRIK